MKANHKEPGSDPKSTENRRLEINLAMTKHGQSGGIRSHASEPATGRRAPNIGQALNVATYNVRTLADTIRETDRGIRHKLQQIIAGCEEHNIDILAIQEHRLTSTEPINYQKLGDWTLAHSSSSVESHGVAHLYNKRIAPLILAVDHKTDRIIATHINGNPKLCIISAYAPTENSSTTAKNNFYEDLKELILAIPPHTVLMLTGDFNARIGKDSYGTNPRIVGPACYYENTNDNGQRMIELCEATDLRIAHSHFLNRKARLYTYIGPKGDRQQLDHIMIRCKWWKSITNCRAYNTIDIGSDHRIVSANFRLSLRADKRASDGRCQYNWTKLSDPQIQRTFDMELRNRFDSLMDEATLSNNVSEVQKRANAFDAALIHSSEKILGKKPKNKHNRWVSDQTLELLNICNKASKRYKRTRNPAHKDQWQLLQDRVSAAFDQDQQAQLDAHLASLELADQRHEHGTAWQIINHIAGDFNKADPSKVRLQNGSIPNNKEELLKGWQEYFASLLNNRNANIDPANKPKPSRPLTSIKTTLFTKSEIDQAIKEFSRKKSPGPDYALTSDVLKDGGQSIREILLSICNIVYKECQAPSQWTSSLIIPLPKKGNLQLMTNWRGICLMSLAAKLYNRMILNRIRSPIDAILRKNQAGFRTGRSCIQQIHILRRIMDGAHSQNIPLFITFVDFKKAFDSIDRDMMFSILQHYGIPDKIVSAIRVLYDQSTCQVYLQGQRSEPFAITTGVLQGDVLAPFLFIIVIDYVSKRSVGDFGYLTHKGNTQDNSGRTVRSTTRETDYKVNDLTFADDIALLENDSTQAQRQLDALELEAGKVGLEINVQKTEQMRLNQSSILSQNDPLVIKGQQINIVDDFKYLGSYVGSTEHDVKVRIGFAWAAFAKVKSILRSPKVKLNFKIRLFKAACISILLYGCESWILTEALIDRLEIFTRTCYRIMLDIKQSRDHVTNQSLYHLTGQAPLCETIRERQLKFTGHCIRMPTDEPANRFVIYESKIRASLRSGAPRTTYLHQISSHILPGEKALEANEIRKMAVNKSKWSQLFVVSKKKKPPDRSSQPE